ncbi:MAG: helix-turn-helix transcriptional regulator [Bacilli bacterium]|nr:helix-turn-helix transcriptional regulator [Bacilli bacterium]
MNQEKIGKFIAKCRKEKKLTQSELGEKLGVTEKSVSNWENGRNMPDLSLFKPLCEILDITINELLSGEKLVKDNYQERFEENIVNTIDYSTKKINRYSGAISLIIIIFGLFISLSAIMIFPSESSWGSIYSVFGIIIFMIGIFRIISTSKWYKKLLYMAIIFIGTIGVFLFTDYVNVKNNDEAPRFRLETTYAGNLIHYDTLFYDVYRCFPDEDTETWSIEKNHKATIKELIDYCK